MSKMKNDLNLIYSLFFPPLQSFDEKVSDKDVATFLVEEDATASGWRDAIPPADTEDDKVDDDNDIVFLSVNAIHSKVEKALTFMAYMKEVSSF